MESKMIKTATKIQLKAISKNIKLCKYHYTYKIHCDTDTFHVLSTLRVT